MLANQDATATVAVKDLDAAKRFYEDKLGLKPVDAGSENVISYKTGASTLMVYASQFAGTNQATSIRSPASTVPSDTAVPTMS